MLHVIDTDAIAAFNRLGLLAIPSDAAAQRRRMRHEARVKSRQLLASIPTKGIAVRRIILEGTPFVEIGKFTRQEGIDLIRADRGLSSVDCSALPLKSITRELKGGGHETSYDPAVGIGSSVGCHMRILVGDRGASVLAV